MEENIINKLKFLSKSENGFLKSISQIILKNLEQIDKINLKDIASLTNYSISSITKFCQKLGYDGWKDLKLKILIDLNYIKNNNNLDKIVEDGDNLSVLTALASVSKKMIDEALELNKDQILNLAKVLEGNQPIFLFGLGFNKLICEHLCKSLLPLKKIIIFNNDTDSQLSYSKTLPQESIAIVFSFSGSSDVIIDIAKNIREQNIKLIVICSDMNSIPVKLADSVIQIPGNESPIRRVAYNATFFVVNALVSLLYKNKNL